MFKMKGPTFFNKKSPFKDTVPTKREASVKSAADKLAKSSIKGGGYSTVKPSDMEQLKKDKAEFIKTA